MEYRTGNIGRVIVARFDHGEDFLAGLNHLLKEEEIKKAWFNVIGGIAAARVVTGPKEPVMPPEPVWREIETREVLGGGTVYWDGDEPVVHLHAALGHHGETVTGCVREWARTYLVLEVTIFEITGFPAARPWFAEGGFKRLIFANGDGD